MEKNETSLYFELINKTVNTIADELKDRPAVQRKVKSFNQPYTQILNSTLRLKI